MACTTCEKVRDAIMEYMAAKEEFRQLELAGKPLRYDRPQVKRYHAAFSELVKLTDPDMCKGQCKSRPPAVCDGLLTEMASCVPFGYQGMMEAVGLDERKEFLRKTLSVMARTL